MTDATPFQVVFTGGPYDEVERDLEYVGQTITIPGVGAYVLEKVEGQPEDRYRMTYRWEEAADA